MEEPASSQMPAEFVLSLPPRHRAMDPLSTQPLWLPLASPARRGLSAQALTPPVWAQCRHQQAAWKGRPPQGLC